MAVPVVEVSAPVPFPRITPFALSVVAPVPPLATGSVPETSVVRTTRPEERSHEALFFTTPAVPNDVIVGAEAKVAAPFIETAPVPVENVPEPV